jgi:hypothetical protein
MAITVAAFDAAGPNNLGFYAHTYDEVTGRPVDVPVMSRGPGAVALAIEFLASALGTGSVSIGIEAPCWIPMAGPGARPQASRFMRKRHFEGSRSWSAPAGGYVTTAGVALVAEIFRGLVHAGAGPITPTFGPGRPGVNFVPEGCSLNSLVE